MSASAPENAIALDVIERDIFRPGMTSGQLADAVIERLGLVVGRYTLVAKLATPGLVFVEPKTRPTDPEWAGQRAEVVIEACRDLWPAAAPREDA